MDDSLKHTWVLWLWSPFMLLTLHYSSTCDFFFVQLLILAVSLPILHSWIWIRCQILFKSTLWKSTRISILLISLICLTTIRWTTTHTHTHTHRFECCCTIKYTGCSENLPRFPHRTTHRPALYPRELRPHKPSLGAKAQLNHEGKRSCWEYRPHLTNSCVSFSHGKH